MAQNVVVDTGFLVALLSRRDAHHGWAVEQAKRFVPPWRTCEAALSEGFHLIGSQGRAAFEGLLRSRAVVVSFKFNEDLDAPLKLMKKYGNVPMSFADACLVRMTETLAEPVLITTDSDFQIYRRHSRLAVPHVRPRGLL